MKSEKWLSIFLIIIALVLAFNYLGKEESFNSPMAKKAITFSEFMRQVKQGNVLDANIQGKQLIEGQFLNTVQYYTYIPPSYPQLVDLLRKHKVQISYSPPAGYPWYISLLIQWGPFLFIIFIWIMMSRHSPLGRIFSIGKIGANKAKPEECKVKFKDIAGAEESKEELKEIIDFLKEPERFHKLGGRIPRGVLMSGSPGTGKTMLAKAVAGEAGTPFFSVSGSAFVEMFVGVGASRVRDLFEEGKKHAPCILFIDEIDAVGRHRGAGIGGGNDEREQTLNQMLVEMDGFDSSQGVIVIAATNRPDILDSALLRPGRFDRQVHIPLPDVKGREAILKIYADKAKMAQDIELSILAKGTPGFSGADLKNLINEATLIAARQDKKEVSHEDLEQARDKILMGSERKSMVMTDKEKRSTAYHEAGHALVAAMTPKADPIHKVTIVPRGRALGVTSFLPEGDHRAYDTDYLIGKIVIAMGGRAAEELIFDELTTGAGNDLQQATNLAHSMICKFGMSEKIGPVVLDDQNSQYVSGRAFGKEREYSEEVACAIDEELRKMVISYYDHAKQLLHEHIDALHELSEQLIQHETVEGHVVINILQKLYPTFRQALPS